LLMPRGRKLPVCPRVSSPDSGIPMKRMCPVAPAVGKLYMRVHDMT
jgi:hypothetical protein